MSRDEIIVNFIVFWLVYSPLMQITFFISHSLYHLLYTIIGYFALLVEGLCLSNYVTEKEQTIKFKMKNILYGFVCAIIFYLFMVMIP